MTELGDKIKVKSFSLYDINRFFNNCHVMGKFKPIIGEDCTRMTALLLFLVGKISVMVRGDAGTGKSQIVNAICTLAWTDDIHEDKVKEVMMICEASAKAFTSEEFRERIKHFKYCVIPEFQNAINHEAMLKLWAEGKPYTYSRAGGTQSTEKVVLPPLPVLTSVADSNKQAKELLQSDEIIRRYGQGWTVGDRTQTENVHKYKAKVDALPDSELISMKEEDIVQLRGFIRECMTYDKKVKNPSMLIMHECVPKEFPESSSFLDYFRQLIKSVTTIHYKDRIEIDGCLLSAPVDNYLAWLIYGTQVKYSALNIEGNIGKIILDILPVCEYNEDSDLASNSNRFSIDQILKELAKRGFRKTKKKIMSPLGKLEWASYIYKDDKERYYKTRELDVDTDINWKKLIYSTIDTVSKHYPDVAKEYIEKYCKGDGLIVQHPFSGDMINLLSIRKCNETTKTTLDDVSKLAEDEDPTIKAIKEQGADLEKIVRNNKGTFHTPEDMAIMFKKEYGKTLDINVIIEEINKIISKEVSQ